MPTLTCPVCRFERAYDPEEPPSYCIRCGRALPPGVGIDAGRAEVLGSSHQPLLDELLSHWEERYVPEGDLRPVTPGRARALYQVYERSPGSARRLRSSRD